MLVNEECVIVFSARCFNDMDLFRRAWKHSKCWVIINRAVTTESLACTLDQAPTVSNDENNWDFARRVRLGNGFLPSPVFIKVAACQIC